MSISRTYCFPVSSPMWYVRLNPSHSKNGINTIQEKLNEAVVVMNKSLQVCQVKNNFLLYAYSLF
jgi:hypothetical protein